MEPRLVSKRLKIILAAGLALVLAILGIQRFWFTLPVGDGPAGPAVPRDAFAKPWFTGPVLLVGIGDSITAGYGSTAGHSFFDRLVTNPADEFADMAGLCLSAVAVELTRMLSHRQPCEKGSLHRVAVILDDRRRPCGAPSAAPPGRVGLRSRRPRVALRSARGNGPRPRRGRRQARADLCRTTRLESRGSGRIRTSLPSVASCRRASLPFRGFVPLFPFVPPWLRRCVASSYF